MNPRSKAIDLAKKLATDLTLDMKWVAGQGGGWWTSDPADAWALIRARATAALDFLERHAGAHSPWTTEGRAVFDNSGDRQSMESGARALGPILLQWADQAEAGHIVVRIADTLSIFEVAATDLMQQVRLLNESSAVNPIAPIVLAGAALEMGLRSAVEQLNLDPQGRPGIAAYGDALRKASVLTSQQAKDVQQMAGVRNEAAHGRNEELSTERARVFEQQVNLFLGQLASTLDSSELS